MWIFSEKAEFCVSSCVFNSNNNRFYRSAWDLCSLFTHAASLTLIFNFRLFLMETWSEFTNKPFGMSHSWWTDPISFSAVMIVKKWSETHPAAHSLYIYLFNLTPQRATTQLAMCFCSHGTVNCRFANMDFSASQTESRAQGVFKMLIKEHHYIL